MNDCPLVSVVIPAYGTDKYLKKCVDSILAQTYKNLEIIIVNDCSKDNVDEIIREYLHKDARIKYIKHKKNKGLFHARLSGAEEATGDYISFIDSDDYISNDFYRLLVLKAVTTNSDITVCNTVFVDIDGSRKIKKLYQLCFEEDELFDENIRNKFFEQEGTCFSWHTVWNKLYSIDLWIKCEKYYRKQSKHLIMTEDIAFSSLLLYNAHHLVKEYNANYYYCKHKEASTYSQNIGITRFSKNMSDIKCAFDFVEDYLCEVNATSEIRVHFDEFRKKYSRMWRTLQVTQFPDNKKARKIVDDFLPGYYQQQHTDEYCFDFIEDEFKDSIDYLKEKIRDKSIRYVSFDIFDTLILRPFYEPTDLFDLIEIDYEKLTNNSSNISFKRMRQLSEKFARESLLTSTNREDITLTEIYEEMNKHFDVASSIINELKNIENNYEIQFCTERKMGKELFKYAQALGKKVYITSDMYLEQETVEKILEKNGFTGYEKLFLSSTEKCLKSGSLYKRLVRFISDKPEHIIHIGDTWNSDITSAEKAGIKTIFLPKAKDIFENTIKDVVTNNCAWTEKYIFGPMVASNECRNNFVYKTMLGMVANKFFDNPYSSFKSDSDFNANPYMIGYYLVGMHCVGIADWIIKESEKNGYDDIYFLARDGYLPKKVFDIIGKKSKIKSHYINGSRKLTLPFMINCKADLFDLPIEKNNHTPLSICNLLSFCSKYDLNQMEDMLSEEMFIGDMNFTDEKNYFNFITFFANNMFDEKKLKESQQILVKYYSQIGNRAAVFDMGYSGRIQAAISKAVGRGVDVFFIHKDSIRCDVAQRKYNFKVHTLYDMVPASTGIMREYILSDIAPACCSMKIVDNEIQMNFEKDNTKYPEKFIIKMIQKGAEDFATDFMTVFGRYVDKLFFDPQILSAPFEYFLRFAKEADRQVFSLCKFEDVFYGNIASVSADKLFNNQLCDIVPYVMPSDFKGLNRVELDISLENKDNEYKSDIEYYDDDDNSDMGKENIPRVAMFYDRVDKQDTIENKFSKCINDTSYIVCWDSLSAIVCPTLIKNWFMTNPGGFEADDFDVYILNNLMSIKEKQDISFVDKILKKIGDKTLLPVTIGLSAERKKSDFRFLDSSIRVLNELAERCKNIGVNGEYTAEILNKQGIKNIKVVGNPSLYCNIGTSLSVSNNQTQIKKVAASFRPFDIKINSDEEKLLNYFAENKFTLFETSKYRLDKELIHSVESYEKIKEIETDKALYFDILAWQEKINEYDFAIGMNYQNNVIALRSGIPAMFVTYETSGEELCKFFNLPSIELCKFDNKKSVMQYYSMADYSNFKKTINKNYNTFKSYLEENGVTVEDVEDLIIEK